MAFYLGIDGGGTKTRCILGNETAVLATAVSGGCNIVRLGEAPARGWGGLNPQKSERTASAVVTPCGGAGHQPP